MKVIKLESSKHLSGKAFTDFRNDVVGKHPFFVFVYAPWCGHCQAMKPQLSKAVKDLTKNKSILLMISDEALHHLQNNGNATMGSALKHIQGFPTLLRIGKTKRAKEYKGSRQADDIMNFLSS